MDSFEALQQAIRDRVKRSGSMLLCNTLNLLSHELAASEVPRWFQL